jgi:hypothetical protein
VQPPMWLRAFRCQYEEPHPTLCRSKEGPSPWPTHSRLVESGRAAYTSLEDSFLRSGRSEGFEEHHDGPPTVSRFLHLRDEVRHQYLPSAKPMILLEASVGRRYPIPRGVSTNAPSSTI